MPHRLAAHERRRQAALLLALSIAVVVSLAFSEYLTRTALGVAAFWPANALLAAGLITLTGSRGLSLTVVFVAFHLIIGLLVGDTLLRALLYLAIDTGEAVTIWAICQRFWRGAPRIRSLRSLILLPAVTTPVAAVASLVVAGVLTQGYGEPFTRGLTDWFLRCALGLAVALPATLVLIDAEHRRTFQRDWREQLLLMFAVAAVTLLCAHPASGAPPFLIFPVALAAAYRLGARGAAMASVVVALITLPIALSGASPRFNAILGAVAQARTIQVFIAVLFYTCLAAGLALAQQDRLKRLLLRRELLTRAARARALAATEAKTEFLATMSHEIRTPLNSVLGFAQLLATREDLPPDVRRQVNLIDSAGAALLTSILGFTDLLAASPLNGEQQRRLGRIHDAGTVLLDTLNDVLDFAKLEAGGVDLEARPFDLRALLNKVIGMFEAQTLAKGLDLALRVDPTCPEWVEGDSDRLRQVLVNFLGNAVKFTGSGSVTLSAMRREGAAAGSTRLELAVSDTGVGVPAAMLETVFDRFAQAGPEVARKFGGTGLGLAISKEIIQLMGGKIGVDSIAGQGARFWCVLDLPVAVAPERHETQDAQGAARPLNLLVADDNEANRELIGTLVRAMGHEVDVVADGCAAVEAAASGGYDLILMDVQMPRMDGLAATRAIRLLAGEAATTPIIALTANVLPDQVAFYRASGMDDHVGKPINPRELLLKIALWGQDDRAAPGGLAMDGVQA